MKTCNSMSYIKTALVALILVTSASCEKPPGPGGNATITGRVFAHDFDNTQRYDLFQSYAAGERVYIMYGNENIVGDDVRTSADGTFEFRYLTKGHYKIFVNSLDTSVKGHKGVDKTNPIIKEVDITGKDQKVSVGDIVINI